MLPTRRGSFRLEEVRLEIQSAARLWSLRARRPVNTEVRVYPNLFADKKTAATLLMNRGAIEIHAQRHVGKGVISRSSASMSRATPMTTSIGGQPPGTRVP